MTSKERRHAFHPLLLLFSLLAPLSADAQSAEPAPAPPPLDADTVAFLEELGREMAAEIASGGAGRFNAAEGWGSVATGRTNRRSEPDDPSGAIAPLASAKTSLEARR